MPASTQLPFASRKPGPKVVAVLAVLGGGLVGSALRTAVGTWIPSAGFPMATLLVNLSGSLFLGFYLARWAVRGGRVLQFWAIGLLGSFTTFSAFSIEVVLLLESGQALSATGYVALSIFGGLASAIAGQRIGHVSP